MKVATQFIQDLVQYKVYAPALIQDIKDSPVSSLKSRGAQTPLLESFLMESMRIHCFQSTAAHRTALKPFAFSGGYTIPAGESVQFYQEKTHFDENRYHEPKIFNPCRYCDSGRVATDVSKEWPFWGVGKNAWYVNIGPILNCFWRRWLIYIVLEGSTFRIWSKYLPSIC